MFWFDYLRFNHTLNDKVLSLIRTRKPQQTLETGAAPAMKALDYNTQYVCACYSEIGIFIFLFPFLVNEDLYLTCPRF